MSERQKRTGANRGKESRSSALKNLKKRKQEGTSLLDEGDSSDDDRIYDEVTQDEFDSIQRRRLQEDDFVVDDDGKGYVDNGEDEWDRPHKYGSESDSEEEDAGGGKRKKNKKDKSSKRVKPEHQLDALFKNQAKKAPSRPSAPKAAPTTKDDENLMADIFADLDAVPVEKAKTDHPSYSYASRPKPLLSREAPPAPKPAAKMDVKRLEQIALFGKSADTRTAVSNVATGIVAELTSGKDKEHEANMHFDDAGFDPGFDDHPAPADPAPGDPEAAADGDEPMADGAEDPTATAEVKVRQVQTARAGTTKSASAFLPTFAAPAAPATASVVQAPLTAGAANWHSIRDEMAAGETSTADAAGPAAPAVAENVLEPDGSLRIFFLDAYEVRDKGVVYLFGKVLDRASGRHISCCVTVNGISRKLFVLPRAVKLDASGAETDVEIEIKDVYDEFDALRRKKNIKSWRSKPIEKKYAFEIAGVPAQSDYLEVSYSFTEPELEENTSGRTFGRIFGTRTTALELLILEREIWGPSWITVKNPVFENRPMSWCKLEVSVANPKQLIPDDKDQNKVPAPPLSVMCLSMKTFMNHKQHANEVVMASAVIYPNLDIDDPRADAKTEHVRFTVVRKLDAMPMPMGFAELAGQQSQKIEVCGSERALLNYLIAQIYRHDPDVIVGHNFIGFDLDVLLHRMKAHKVENWSRIGRLRRSQWPKLQAGAGGGSESTFAEKQIASGRLMCDTWLTAKEHIRAKSYSLSNLALMLLKTSRETVDPDTVPQYYHRAGDLLTLVKHTETDAYLAAMIMFKIQVLPLSKQITNLAGNLWSRTLIGGRAERNEMLLLHEFHKLGFILPDKGQMAKKAVAIKGDDDDDDEPQADARRSGTTGRRKPAYSGGLVLEPKKGLYDKYVLLLDFNSLYPSIIQEFNLDFTTVQRSSEPDADDQLPDIPDQSLPQGVLPKLLKTLVERRRQVKNLMKAKDITPAEAGQYEIRQKALKLTANSMYGCLGFSNSRFYCKPLAMLTTAKGREILQSTVDLAETAKLEVIYGDTDSIMIYTNTDDLGEVKKMGNEFKKIVNQRYKLLEIEVDGFYRRMLLLKKKKYAALVVTENSGTLETAVESKGLDMVRRDWCGLSQDVSAFVLDQILSGDEAGKEEIVEKIHTYLRKVGEETRAGLIPIEKMVINKSLTKNVKEYNDAKVQPHVQVAIRMEARGQSARVGDTIPYVICVAPGDARDQSIANRAFHPDEVMKEGSGLVIDYEWYLQNQIVGPVQRLCDPIEGTDSGRIADCLGLDSTKYRASVAMQEFDTDEVKTLDSQISDEERFRDVDRWNPRCRHCNQHSEFELLRHQPGDLPQCGIFCPNPECKQRMPLPSLQAQLNAACRSHVERYQQSWLVCDDLSCGNRTRQVSVYGKRCLVRGCKGVMKLEYSDTKLFTQLSYYASLVDVDRLAAKLEGKDDRENQLAVAARFKEPLAELKREVMAYLSKNDRNYVNLRDLFSGLSLLGIAKIKLPSAAITA
ncbi:hypothetical protein DFJ74DRAFT_618536 [Hyaloraphidium curvatum]|nr:hypothetical protein DFJ74DRAFT_618536 [Hyaloraphidium curvatum]